MKLLNRMITIVIMAVVTPLLTAAFMSLMLGGFSGEFMSLVFIFSAPMVLILGTPIALLINHHFRARGVPAFLAKLVLHIVAGIVLVFIFLSVSGGARQAWSDDSIIFYISGVVNSVVYLIVFTLLKRTGATDFP